MNPLSSCKEHFMSANHKTRIVTILLSMLGLSACSSLERHPRSGYFSSEERTEAATNLYDERRRKQEREVREELGLLNRALNDSDVESLRLRMQLKGLESRLQTRREQQQYYQVRSQLKNDRERIAFLSLPHFEARDRWIALRGLNKVQDGHPTPIAELIEANDIALGMTQKAVMESWGDPDAVEVAGNPVFGHERWLYSRFVSDSEGYQRQTRAVYFEGGVVVGWERL
jgi:hypothetical protein